MSYNYFSTLYKSYSIISSTKINLSLSPGQLTSCLILAKVNSLEIFSISPEKEIESQIELKLFADILFISTIPSGNSSSPDYLFILTSDYRFVISLVSLNEINNLYCGDFGYKYDEDSNMERNFYLNENFVLPNKSIKGYIGCYLYSDEIKFISYKILENNKLIVNPPFTIKLMEDPYGDIIDIIEFGMNNSLNTNKNEYFLGLLVLNDKENLSLFKMVKFEDVEGDAKVLGAGEDWIIRFPEPVHKVIRVNENEKALLAFSNQHVYYYFYDNKKKNISQVFSSNIRFYVRIPDRPKFFLLSDYQNGGLYYLALDLNENHRIEIKYLGETCIVSTLQYLCNKNIFVGSLTDNAYLLKILDVGDINNSKTPYLSTLKKFNNLGEINSIDILKNQYSNDNLLIASPSKNESLNIFQKGTNVNHLFSLKLTDSFNLNNAFWLKKLQIGFLLYNSLIYNFIIKDYKIELFKNPNLPSKDCIYVCENKNMIYMVYIDSIIIFNDNYQFIKQINLSNLCILAVHNSVFLCLIINNNINQLNFFHFDSCTFVREQTFSQQISNLFINNDYLALSFWFDSHIQFIMFNDFKIVKIPLVQNKSILQEFNMEGTSSINVYNNRYLLIGFIDGTLVIKHIDENLNVLSENLIIIGKKPVSSKIINENLYVWSENTYKLIIQEVKNYKIEKIYLELNAETLLLDEISNSDQENYILITKNSIKLLKLIQTHKFMILPFSQKNSETIEAINKNSNSLPFHNNYIDPNYKAYFLQNGPIYSIVSFINWEHEPNENSELLLFNRINQEFIEKFNDFDNEIITDLLYDYIKGLILVVSIVSTVYDNKRKNFIRFFYLENKIPSKIDNNKKKINLLKKVEFSDEIQAIKKFDDNHYVVFIGTNLCIYEITQSENFFFLEFQEKLKKNLQIIVTQIDVINNLIMICDPHKHISLYNYNVEDNRFMFVAKSYTVQSLIHASFFGSNKIVHFNKKGQFGGGMIISQQKQKPDIDLDKIILQNVVGMNFVETITCSIRESNILFDECKELFEDKIFEENEQFIINTLFLGSRRGSLYILAELPPIIHGLLLDLQEAILMDSKCLFGFDYRKWRDLKDGIGNTIKNNIVDGEIIRSILDVSIEKLERIVNKMSMVNKPKLIKILQLIKELDSKIFC